MCKSDVIPWQVHVGNGVMHQIDAFVENILLPESTNDVADALPMTHLKHLLDVGLVNIITSPPTHWNGKIKFAITEQVAFGCLDTWFVITQHWGAASIVQRSCHSLASFWDGQSLLGVGFGHLRRSTPCLRAEFVSNQFNVQGNAPWITGSAWLSWVIYGATLNDKNHIYFRVPHTESDGYKIGQSQSLAAVKRTDTREVNLDISIPNEYVLTVQSPEDLSNQDELTLVTSMAPIMGLIGRCLYDWNLEVKPDNRTTLAILKATFERLRSKTYAILDDINATSLSDRLLLRQDLHTLLETIIHVWSLSSGGQSNTSGMVVIRRRQEAAFFRVFQQTKILKDAAVTSALSRLTF